MWILFFVSSLQTHPDTDGSIPLLALNEEQKLMLFPMLFLHEEAPQPCNSASWTNVPCIAADTEFPLGKWVHVGCEVSCQFTGTLLFSWSPEWKATGLPENLPFIWRFFICNNLTLKIHLFIPMVFHGLLHCCIDEISALLFCSGGARIFFQEGQAIVD